MTEEEVYKHQDYSFFWKMVDQDNREIEAKYKRQEEPHSNEEEPQPPKKRRIVRDVELVFKKQPEIIDVESQSDPEGDLIVEDDIEEDLRFESTNKSEFTNQPEPSKPTWTGNYFAFAFLSFSFLLIHFILQT